MRRSFWPLVLGAILLEVAASAALTVAFINRRYESNVLYDRLIQQTSDAHTQKASPGIVADVRGSIRGLEDPLPWLLAGVLLALLGLALLVVARPRR